MKKHVDIEYETKDGIDYFVLKISDSSIYVDKKKKTIDGKDIFNFIYSDLTKDNFFEIEVNCSSLSEEDKKTFGSYVIKMFSLIDIEMKKQFPDDGNQLEQPISDDACLEE